MRPSNGRLRSVVGSGTRRKRYGESGAGKQCGESSEWLVERDAGALERFRTKHALGLDPGVDTGSREENASRQESRALVLIQSEPIML
jgi:hypothetical protein